MSKRSNRPTTIVEVYVEIEPDGRQKPGFILNTFGTKYHDRLSEYFGTRSYLTLEPEVEWEYSPAEPEIGIFSASYEAVNITSLGPIDCSYKLFDGMHDATIEEKDLPQDIVEILKDYCVNWIVDREIEGPDIGGDDYYDECADL